MKNLADMLMKYQITREIQIDAAHRVPNHASKCRHLHGHRYVIQATCEGPLLATGESEGMVLDFSFLKEEMMRVIDGPCDHALIVWNNDPLFENKTVHELGGKVAWVDFVPTAENLARHWFEMLVPGVRYLTKERAVLTRVRVYETPNCWADYNKPT